MDNYQRGDATAVSPSALAEFAEIFSFLNNFGPLLSLPAVSFTDLESFFNGGHNELQSPVVYCHWSLLTHVTKKDSQVEWQTMAVKFGRKQGLFSEACMYCDLSLEQRMKIFKHACEGQFDSNVALREKLEKLLPEVQVQPIGYDRDGQRHWFFKDMYGDLRLYAEREYDQFPADESVWDLVCRTIEDLVSYIAKLESRALLPPTFDGCPDHTHGICDGTTSLSASHSVDPSGGGSGDQANVQCRVGRKKRKDKMVSERGSGGRGSCGRGSGPMLGVGCIKCHQDSDYAQLLLCDICNRECHTYCQYPVLWCVPQGTWVCPLCSEALLKSLKAEHIILVETRVLQEEAVEKTKRKAVRLQRSGVLLQNIIEDEGCSGRSRRTRKAIDYASLNDFYLPPLGPEDYVSPFVGSNDVMNSNDVADTSALPMRQSQRLKGSKVDVHRPLELLTSDSQVTFHEQVTLDAQITDNKVTSDEQVTPGSVGQATSNGQDTTIHDVCAHALAQEVLPHLGVSPLSENVQQVVCALGNSPKHS